MTADPTGGRRDLPAEQRRAAGTAPERTINPLQRLIQDNKGDRLACVAFGEGGEELHEWVIELAAWREPHGRAGGEVNASSEVVEKAQANVGAVIMGRNMFGGGPGP